MIHHSHITGEIIDYSHGFSNRNVRENKNNIIVIAHNLFGFDFFFFLKGVRLSVWKTKNLSIGGSNLTQINYANISERVKFTDTMKYYQQSLAKLVEIMADQEEERIKNQSKKFIEKHEYFGKVFKYLLKTDQEWILEYMSSGKGVIPYETMNSFESLNIVPTAEFFTIEDFYSSLRNYVNASVKKLYTFLKMRNLGDLNNLYNIQDTIILCEIFESRAQFLNDKFKFNPRTCNSASLSG